MAIRRSLPLTAAIAYERTLTDAVRIARERKEELCELLLENNLVRIDGPTLEHYLELYANDDSVELGPLQYRAIDKLYELGFEHGFYDAPIRAEDYTIPREYPDFRYS